jgi:hypothetical protein
MKRRNFIILLGGIVAWPHHAKAQGTQKVWRIGHIFPAAPSIVGHFADAFERGMADLGYYPGRNLIVTAASQNLIMSKKPYASCCLKLMCWSLGQL